MKYLRKFATKADAEALGMPNVVLFADTKAVAYNYIPYGVYIQHIDGGLYSEEDWSANGFSNDLANGVAVVDANCRFVVAKNDLPNKNAWLSNDEELIPELGTSTNVTAVKDFNGYQNTQIMLRYGESGAAHDCVNFVFPNGRNGYLPAEGELKTVYTKKTAITNALILIGGAALLTTGATYWSSTQKDATRAWRYYFLQSSVDDIGKYNKIYIRPFTTL